MIDFGIVNDPKVFLAAICPFVKLTKPLLAAFWAFVKGKSL